MKTTTTTQVAFTVDTNIKERAMRRARAEGIPFAAVLKLATKAFADGEFSMGIVEAVRPEKLNGYQMQSRKLNARKGKQFASAKAASDYLRTL